MKRIIAIGEAMIEFSPAGGALYAMGVAGDTFNTAAYLARAFQGRLAVDYMTALGRDASSDRIVGRIAAEGIGTSLIPRLPDRSPGLYVITNDAEGERSFEYWRQASAARSMLRGQSEEDLVQLFRSVDTVYLSGITLAILNEADRTLLLDALGHCPGTEIGFDPNHRPALWPDEQTAISAYRQAAGRATCCLVTAEDDTALFGADDTTAIGARWAGWGAGEVVVKDGAEGCLVLKDGAVTHVPVPEPRQPVDTTGAGDSFAAGYIGARLFGSAPQAAARYAHHLAGTVICHKGGVIDPGVPLPRFQPDPG